MGTVYLIHFDQPLAHARHYLGYSKDAAKRLDRHALGHGARLMQVIQAAGITWQLARTWSGERSLERQLKRRKCSPRLCPICNPKAGQKTRKKTP